MFHDFLVLYLLNVPSAVAVAHHNSLALDLQHSKQSPNHVAFVYFNVFCLQVKIYAIRTNKNEV